VSHELALEHAETEFDKFDAVRRSLEATQPVSDFDHAVEQVKQLGKGDPAPPKPARRARNRIRDNLAMTRISYQ